MVTGFDVDRVIRHIISQPDKSIQELYTEYFDRNSKRFWTRHTCYMLKLLPYGEHLNEETDWLSRDGYLYQPAKRLEALGTAMENAADFIFKHTTNSHLLTTSRP